MHAVMGSVMAAAVASACCLGPVLFASIGAGALSAASTHLEPFRPWFLGVTVLLLAVGFARTYRQPSAACADGTCAPSSRRTGKIVLWLAVVLTGLLAMFPYYSTWLV